MNPITLTDTYWIHDTKWMFTQPQMTLELSLFKHVSLPYAKAGFTNQLPAGQGVNLTVNLRCSWWNHWHDNFFFLTLISACVFNVKMKTGKWSSVKSDFWKKLKDIFKCWLSYFYIRTSPHLNMLPQRQLLFTQPDFYYMKKREQRAGLGGRRRRTTTDWHVL